MQLRNPCSLLKAAAAVLLAARAGVAQTQEMTTRELDAPATFRSKINLVLVPVVVRDKKGDPIGTLKKEDFEVFDKGKPQTILKFSIEKAGSRNVEFEPDAPSEAAPDPSAPKGQPLVVAERYTVFLFDDVHLTMSDLLQVRVAAEKHLAEGLLPTERVAVFTTSGRTALELTDDREKIVTAMRAVRPTGMSNENRRNCPPMSYYMADQIANLNNPQALAAAVSDTIACASLDPTDPATKGIATQMAQSAASQALPMGDQDTRQTLANLKQVVRMLATMPGQRNLVFISPGFFLVREEHSTTTELIDLAIRSRVTINSLDARGLHLAGVLPDITETSYSPETTIIKSQYDRFEATEASALLGELAAGTGGSIFQNNNDLTGGFKKLTATPEYIYVLGFSPQNLKYDGAMHTLAVKIKDGKQFTMQARRGYYAPKHLADPKEEARREIQEALFSRDVLRDLPVELHTQYFKGSEYEAKLGVLARVDLAQMRFKKEDGRNVNNLTIVAALFDKNGNFIKGASKIIEMKLKDETLQNKARSVITIKTNFDVRIGGYVVRLVVRDSEGQLMAAQNGSVVIP